MQTIEPLPPMAEIASPPPVMVEAEIPLVIESEAPITAQWQEMQASLQSQLQEWRAQVQPTLERTQTLANQVVATLTSETAINIYRRTLVVVGTAITVMLIVALYLGIACYLAGATVRTLLAQRQDAADHSEIASPISALEAVARLPLTTQATAEAMIDRAEVAIAKSRELLIPMRHFAQKVADLYQAPPSSPAELATTDIATTIDPALAFSTDGIENCATVDADSADSPAALPTAPDDSAIATSSASLLPPPIRQPTHKTDSVLTREGSYLS